MKELQILDVIGGVADDLVLEAKEAGMSFGDFCEKIMEMSLRKK